MPYLKDGSIYSNGKIVFVSIERFKEKVCKDLVCFLCASTMIEETKEHVVPDWILKLFSLYNMEITLPNDTKLKYRNYIVPCCESCNQLLSRELESPLSKAFRGGFESVEKFLIEGGGVKLFCWLALIFIKMHYKANLLPFERDRRKGNQSIAEEMEYDWGELHHTYCLARSAFTGAEISTEALGSLAIFRLVIDTKEREAFDIAEFVIANTFAIRINEVGVIVCFGDGGAVLGKLDELFLKKINGNLSYPQFRELVAHFACCRLHLKNPPSFATLTNRNTGKSYIECTQKEKNPEFYEFDQEVFGRLLYRMIYEPFKNNVEILDFKGKLLRNEVGFLFSESGEFIQNDESSE